MDPNILEAARFIGGWALDPVLRFSGIQVKDERWLKNLGLIFIAVIVGSSVIIMDLIRRVYQRGYSSGDLVFVDQHPILATIHERAILIQKIDLSHSKTTELDPANLPFACLPVRADLKRNSYSDTPSTRGTPSAACVCSRHSKGLVWPNGRLTPEEPSKGNSQ
jgi:hypothetical protein